MKELKKVTHQFVAVAFCFCCLFFRVVFPSPLLAGEKVDERHGKLTRPEAGMSVGEFMKVCYQLKYVRDCKDYYCLGGLYLVNKKGFKRERRWDRYRIILDDHKDGVDYKDMIVFTKPQNVKGLAVLTWTYLDPNRDQDVWLWLPSLRKIRRVSQTEEDDSFLGTDWTYEEVSTRMWEDETYRLLGEETFSGYSARYNNSEYNKGIACYLVEAKPKKKDWYYVKRNIYLNKDTAQNIFEELYDSKGVKFKTLSRLWGGFGGPYVTEDYIEVIDFRADHMSVIDVEKVKYDQGLNENFFSERTLMRTKW